VIRRIVSMKILLIALVALFSFPTITNAAGYKWQLVVKAFKNPTDVVFSPDGTGRLFVLEQPGTIRIVKDGKISNDVFLNVASQLTSSGNEQGLLGLAFHPKYSENGLFFIAYTDKKGQPTLARYAVSKSSPDQADASSGKVLLSVPHPFPNHNGGEIEFGPDGYLYWGIGDGGAAADPFDNGQNVQTMLGAILRLDINTDVYAIPPDNPFKNVEKARPELWAIGLRNPWRFSFDSKTGDLYIADVGQNRWEEIDVQPAGSKGGENYGWAVYEGNMEFKPNPDVPRNKVVFPVTEYEHGDAGCSVTGGFVYHGKALPELDGTYIYGDYCSGWMWTLKRNGTAWTNTKFMESGFAITSFGLDADGELYVMDRKSGGLYKLVAG